MPRTKLQCCLAVAIVLTSGCGDDSDGAADEGSTSSSTGLETGATSVTADTGATAGTEASGGSTTTESGEETLDSSSDGTGGEGPESSGETAGSSEGDASSGDSESSSTGEFVEVPEDEAHFIPQHVPNTLRVGGIGEVWLTLYASTLVDGPNGVEYYTAVRNDGEIPVCLGSVTTYFVDVTDTLVASWSAGLYLRNYYRRDQGTGNYTLCIAPGDIAMTASTMDLPPEIVIDELWYLMHEFPGFLFYDIVPVEPLLTVTDVVVVPNGDGGGHYTGTFTNRSDTTLDVASVSIFPVNRVGRPLGMATSRTEVEVPPGGSVAFETSMVADLGNGFVTAP